MGKVRFALGLLMALAALGVVAAPAMAWFQGETAQRGKGSAGVSTLKAGGATDICTSAEGGWEVWSKGTVITKEEQIQAEVTVGPHLLVAVSKWNSCTVEIGGKILASTVKPCNFQLEQPTKGQITGITADVASECSITTGTCVIKIPAANGAGTNEGLKEVSGTNVGTSLEAKANIATGITQNVNAACKALGLSSSTTGAFLSTITGEHQKEV